MEQSPMTSKYEGVTAQSVIEFKLVRTPEDLRNEESFFRPLMSYTIFGEKERIIGYHNLKIKLYYTASWMECYYGLEYSSKLPEFEPTDILRKISNMYEIPIHENYDEFERKLENDKTFKPFGELVTCFSTYKNDLQQDFEVYHTQCNTQGFFDFYKRFQTFLFWFIEGATFIEDDDINWNIFVVYEKYTTSDKVLAYAPAGLTTVYNYYAYPDRVRPRISQVLVLPPFQARGIAAKLLRAIYNFYGTKSNIMDYTVEDPTDEFQRVRDYVDCRRVEASQLFEFTINQGNLEDTINKLHTVLKLNKRQAHRICEILRLRNMDEDNATDLQAYRIDVKRRLGQPFQKKLGAKFQLPYAEQDSEEVRKEKLEALYQHLMEDYKAVIQRLGPKPC